LVPLRERVLEKYRQVSRGAAEDAAQWRAVGDWLAADPPGLGAYRGLGLVVHRLTPPHPRDPGSAPGSFLRRRDLPFALRGASVAIPYDSDASVPDDAVLTFRVGQQVLSFPLDLSRTRRDPQARVTTYTFQGPLQRATYRPGEAFEVSLGLREGKALTWRGARTQSYAFE